VPIWNDPPRRLLDALQRLKKDRREQGQDDISIEKVQAVTDSGGIIKNRELTATGRVPLRAGQRVYVANVDGQPQVILADTARRAQFPQQPSVVAGEVIEELFIATDLDTGRVDVFYRNYDQVTPLGVWRSLVTGEVLQRVAWAPRGTGFSVELDNLPRTFAVFKLNRDPDVVYAPGQKAVATFVSRYDARTDPSGVITITLTKANGQVLGTNTIIMQTLASPSGQTLPLLAGSIPSSQIVTIGTITAFPDEKHHLILNIVLTFAGFGGGVGAFDTSLALLYDATESRLVFHTFDLFGLPSLNTVNGPSGVIASLTLASSNGAVAGGGTATTTTQAGFIMADYFGGELRKAWLTYTSTFSVFTRPELNVSVSALQFFNRGQVTFLRQPAVSGQVTERHMLYFVLTPSLTVAFSLINRSPFSDVPVGTLPLGPGLAFDTRLRLLTSDFAYAVEETERKFVKAWDFGPGTALLNVTQPFVEETAMSTVKHLKDLPFGVSPTVTAYHVINDVSVLTPLARYRRV